MKSFGFLGAVLWAATALAACDAVLEPSQQVPELAPGWAGQLVVNGLTKPRSIVFDSDGRLLVLDSGVGVRRLELEDNGGTCLSVKENEALIEDKEVSLKQCH